jgi:hypothetical protein
LCYPPLVITFSTIYITIKLKIKPVELLNENIQVLYTRQNIKNLQYENNFNLLLNHRNKSHAFVPVAENLLDVSNIYSKQLEYLAVNFQ